MKRIPIDIQEGLVDAVTVIMIIGGLLVGLCGMLYDLYTAFYVQ
jgi:hypothetical protein